MNINKVTHIDKKNQKTDTSKNCDYHICITQMILEAKKVRQKSHIKMVLSMQQVLLQNMVSQNFFNIYILLLHYIRKNIFDIT